MKKPNETEQMLIDALDRLVSGNPLKTNGKITQDNIAAEAGISRATFNRYPRVVAEYQRVKLQRDGDDAAKPFTIEDKNRELQESYASIKRKHAEDKKDYERKLGAARQEVFILSEALRTRDKKIAEGLREIAELKRRLTELEKRATDRLSIVK